MPRRLDSQTTESRKNTNNMPLMPVNAASITSVEPVAHGAVPRRIECCCKFKNRPLKQVMVLFEQHPYFVRRRSRALGYRRPCSSRVWSASRVGTLPSFFRAGRRLYHSWTVHQCWRSSSTVDSSSLLIFALSRVSSFFPKRVKSVRSFRVCFQVLFFSVRTGP